MPAATIKSVGEPREWTSPDGARVLEFIDLIFVDGSKGTYTSKPGHSQDHVDRFIRLIGQPGEFQLEPKPDHNGQKQWKVADYPGKPKPQGFGGGRTESWGYSEAGSRFREDQSNRRTALMCAKEVALADSDADSDMKVNWVVEIADEFYEWLSDPPAGASFPSDAAGTAGRDEAQGAAVAEPSRPATTPEAAWKRYTTAQAALQSHLKLHSLTQVRLTYVKPFCVTQGWDFPPTSGWPAEDIEAIAVMLERRLAVEAHSTAEAP